MLKLLIQMPSPILTIRTLTNLTAKKELQADRSEDVSLSEILEDGLVFSVPANFCKEGHRLELVMEAAIARNSEQKSGQKPDDAVQFRATLKAQKVEGDPNEVKVVRGEFVNFNREQWVKILTFLQAGQERASDLLVKLKG